MTLKHIGIATLVSSVLYGCGSAESDPTEQSANLNAQVPEIGAAIDKGDIEFIGGSTNTVENNLNSNVIEPAIIENTVDSEIATPQVSTQTADLQASTDFDFATSWEMDIEFDLPLSNTYMSLCTDYMIQDNGTVNVEFDSCIVRAPISDGQFSTQDVPMTNAVESLIAVLIDYSNPSEPMYTEFAVQPGKQQLQWEEGVGF